VQIPPSKVMTCDIRPGRRPRGAALTELVAEYRRRAMVPDGDPDEVRHRPGGAPGGEVAGEVP
jgi:formate dehydrogenase major subunit